MAAGPPGDSISTSTTQAQLVLPDVAQRSPEVSTGSDLPVDLVDLTAHRLGLFAAAVAGIAVLDCVTSHGYGLLYKAGWPDREDWLDLTGSAIAILLSLLMVAAVRRKWASSAGLMRLGEAYLVLLAYIISYTDHSDYFWKDGGGLHGLPSSAAIILTFPVLVPSTPLRAGLIGLVMAATGPLALWTLCATVGYEQPSASAVFETFPWLAALTAAVLAGIVHDLGRRLKRAQNLGAYTLEEKLGAGGMGDVYRARHTLLMREAAIKLIRTARSPDPTTRERFKREARATASLKSPHTVELYDFGVSQDGSFYYVMELLDGFDLERLVDKYGPQEPARVLEWMKQVCHSLREAHALGLVHRDIKPANLIVCRYGLDYDFIKLLDFGLVSWHAPLEVSDSRLTGAEEIRGTPAFMAPELVLQNGPIDGRADLYALGCVAFWLLTGRNVFEGKSAIEVIVSHVHERAPSPSLLSLSPVPDALEQIVLACLEKSPDARPESASALLERLEACSIEPAWTAQRAEAWWQEAQA
jgi:serine/threonine-protein kinase